MCLGGVFEDSSYIKYIIHINSHHKICTSRKSLPYIFYGLRAAFSGQNYIFTGPLFHNQLLLPLLATRISSYVLRYRYVELGLQLNYDLVQSCNVFLIAHNYSKGNVTMVTGEATCIYSRITLGNIADMHSQDYAVLLDSITRKAMQCPFILATILHFTFSPKLSVHQ